MSACHRASDYRKEPPVFSLKRTNFYWFSDTFILFSDDFSFAASSDFIEDLLRDFLQSVKLLFLRFLYYGFPLRGGIDYGEFIVDPAQNIYIGEALIRAYKNSEIHEWSGVSLSSDLARRITCYRKVELLLKSYEVPVKDNSTHLSKVIDWPVDQTIKLKNDPEGYIRNQFQRYSGYLDDKAERYLRNTITFLRNRVNSVGKKDRSFQ